MKLKVSWPSWRKKLEAFAASSGFCLIAACAIGTSAGVTGSPSPPVYNWVNDDYYIYPSGFASSGYYMASLYVRSGPTSSGPWGPAYGPYTCSGAGTYCSGSFTVENQVAGSFYWVGEAVDTQPNTATTSYSTGPYTSQ